MTDEPFPPYQPHSQTSFDAAAAALATASTKRAMVYRLIRNASTRGMTDEELEIATGWSGSTVRPRRRELQTWQPEPLVMDSGRQRRTRRGRKAVVWVVTR